MKTLFKYIPYLIIILALFTMTANAFPQSVDYIPLLAHLQTPEGIAIGICATTCAVVVPPGTYSDCLSIEHKPGGIKRAVFSSCDVTWDLATGTAWNTQLAANKVRATGRIVGQLPKGTFNKKKVDSSSPEIVIGGTQSVTFRDYNVNTASHTFYNTITDSPNKFRFAFLGSGNDFYGFFDNISVEAGLVKEEDSETGSSYWDVVVMWTGKNIPAPIADFDETFLEPTA